MKKIPKRVKGSLFLSTKQGEGTLQRRQSDTAILSPEFGGTADAISKRSVVPFVESSDIKLEQSVIQTFIS